MILFIIGLIVFVGLHMIRIVADDWRTQMIAKQGEKRYKNIFSILSMVSFVMLVWGYAGARADSADLWFPSATMYPIAAGLMLISMLVLAGFHVSTSHISVKLRHPMLWSIVIFCSAHLLVNGRLIDVLLFGSLLIWSVLNLYSCYQRDQRNAVSYPVPQLKATIKNVLMGLVFYAVFAFFLHKILIGVPTMPV